MWIRVDLCWNYFDCRDATITREDSEGCSRNNPCFAMLMLMQNSCFRLLMLLSLSHFILYYVMLCLFLVVVFQQHTVIMRKWEENGET
jgi:hypothetical protein